MKIQLQVVSKAVAYVDGACSGNGRADSRGGWAVVFDDGEEFSGPLESTTNNRAELIAVEMAVRLCGLGHGSDLVIATDSQNVIGWLSLGWRGSAARC